MTDNPSGRFGARGERAEALLANAPWNDYYGPNSPLEHLCKLGGKILRIGADPDTTTVLHYAEYLAEVPRKSVACVDTTGAWATMDQSFARWNA